MHTPSTQKEIPSSWNTTKQNYHTAAVHTFIDMQFTLIYVPCPNLFKQAQHPARTIHTPYVFFSIVFSLWPLSPLLFLFPFLFFFFSLLTFSFCSVLFGQEDFVFSCMHSRCASSNVKKIFDLKPIISNESPTSRADQIGNQHGPVLVDGYGKGEGKIFLKHFGTAVNRDRIHAGVEKGWTTP